MTPEAQQILNYVMLGASILATVIAFVWILLPFYLLSRLKKMHTALTAAANTLERMESKLLKQNTFLETLTKK